MKRGEVSEDIIGPMLVLDDADDTHLHLAAVVVTAVGAELEPLVCEEVSYSFQPLAHIAGRTVFRARFALPARADASYRALGQEFPVAGAVHEDLRIAFASCNGEENGDLDRDETERNVMWARLCADHVTAPFALLLHGGDQIYADEATKGHPLSDNWPESVPKDPGQAELDALQDHLRARFLDRYLALFDSSDYAWLVARVPSLAQWDDHDICDGWGSLPRSRTYSPVGQTLFHVARDMALLFQHATVDGDLPPRFHDRKGHYLGWSVDLPGVRLIAPDLRSERTRRQIMGEGGWAMMEALAEKPAPARTLMISSVPLLGPRLSILEALMIVIPKMQHYEDDLRDQWQSRAHRAAWRRMLKLLIRMAQSGGTEITVLSGEIHLATRATMQMGDGRALHQLVASGVTHRAPPKAWARTLGALAAMGEDPLPQKRITVHPVPGQARRYVAERNTLELIREAGGWSAVWSMEHAGKSAPLHL
jgi:hypothetical protein